MVSSEAEKRRKRFLKAKKDAGGSFGELQIKTKNLPWYVYFLKDGEIVAVSPEKMRKKKGWLVQTFSKEQLDILQGKNIQLFRVRQDPEIDTVFSIELKPVESVYVRTEDDFVSLIDFENIKNSDILVSVKDKKFVCTLSKKQKTKYKKINIDDASVKGSKILKFYFTSINDPHFMIYSLNINLKDLILQDNVTKVVPANLSKCSVYTIKLFDTYVRS
tara:strand:- start:157 stop:810 length:654 start_codon:yes stop_codon:yes gene_type:complete